MIRRFLGSLQRKNNDIADAIYMQIVAAARQPLYFSRFGVPDTPIGRFEAIALHMVLYLRRAKSAGADCEATAQQVTEEFFNDVDYALRELGIGDTSVPKRMKKLAKMFYGRAASYTVALDEGNREALASALMRNILPDNDRWEGAGPMANHVFRIEKELREMPDSIFSDRTFSFPEVVAEASGSQS